MNDIGYIGVDGEIDMAGVKNGIISIASQATTAPWRA